MEGKVFDKFLLVTSFAALLANHFFGHFFPNFQTGVWSPYWKIHLRWRREKKQATWWNLILWSPKTMVCWKFSLTPFHWNSPQPRRLSHLSSSNWIGHSNSSRQNVLQLFFYTSALRTLTKRLFYYSRRIASNEHHDFLVNEYDDTLSPPPTVYNVLSFPWNATKAWEMSSQI